jgi:hypothetical protein
MDPIALINSHSPPDVKSSGKPAGKSSALENTGYEFKEVLEQKQHENEQESADLAGAAVIFPAASHDAAQSPIEINAEPAENTASTAVSLTADEDGGETGNVHSGVLIDHLPQMARKGNHGVKLAKEMAPAAPQANAEPSQAVNGAAADGESAPVSTGIQAFFAQPLESTDEQTSANGQPGINQSQAEELTAAEAKKASVTGNASSSAEAGDAARTGSGKTAKSARFVAGKVDPRTGSVENHAVTASAKTDEAAQETGLTAAFTAAETQAGSGIAGRSGAVHAAVEKQANFAQEAGRQETVRQETGELFNGMEETVQTVMQTDGVLNEAGTALTNADDGQTQNQQSSFGAGGQGIDQTGQAGEEIAQPLRQNEAPNTTGGTTAHTTENGFAVSQTPTFAGEVIQTAPKAELSAANFQQITQAVEISLQTGRKTARIQLHPQDMGTIDIQLSSDKNGVGITILTEHASTGRLLEGQGDSLRNALDQAGLNLTHLNFGMRGENPQTGGQSTPNNPMDNGNGWIPKHWSRMQESGDVIQTGAAVLSTSLIDYRV